MPRRFMAQGAVARLLLCGGCLSIASAVLLLASPTEANPGLGRFQELESRVAAIIAVVAPAPDVAGRRAGALPSFSAVIL